MLNRCKVNITNMAISWNKIQRRNPQNNALAWYPTISLNSSVTAKEVILGIVEKCTLTRVDVEAVLIALEEVIIEQLKNGNSVRFGSLGSFRPTMQTRVWDSDKKKWGKGGCVVPDTIYADDGTVELQGVTSDHIAGISVTFTKSSEMMQKLARNQLKFRMVAGQKKYPAKA